MRTYDERVPGDVSQQHHVAWGDRWLGGQKAGQAAVIGSHRGEALPRPLLPSDLEKAASGADQDLERMSVRPNLADNRGIDAILEKTLAD